MKYAFINENNFVTGLLGRLTKSNLKITLVFYPALILVFILLGVKYSSIGTIPTLILFFAGIIIWTFLEYFFNRFISKIDQSFPSLKKINYVIHGIHYNNPKNQERLFMAPVPGLLLSLITFSFWFLFLRENTFAFVAGIISGYLFYACVHYAVHRRPGKLFSHALWIHHLKHHYKYPDKAFGVSSPLWDFVFGTMPPKDEESRRQFS